MPSIQQIIAEIQLAPDLPPSHKVKAVQIIRDAEQRLKIKGATGRPRKPVNAKNLATLDAWEASNGPLAVEQFKDWVAKKGLCARLLTQMVQEFRTEMLAKGKQYADFRLAFIVYLTKGYLSRKLEACVLEKSPYRQTTILDNRGGLL